MLLLASLYSGGCLHIQEHVDTQQFDRLTNSRTVLMLPLKNLTEFPAWTVPMEQSLVHELSHVSNLRIISPEKITEFLEKQNLALSERFDRAFSQQLGKKMGAQTILQITLTDITPEKATDAHVALIDTESGHIALSSTIAQQAHGKFNKATNDELIQSLAGSISRELMHAMNHPSSLRD